MIRPFLEHRGATNYPSVTDLKARAKQRLPKFVYDYLAGGLGRERSLSRNEQAFNNIELVPKFLAELDSIDSSIELFEQNWSLPLGISPVGFADLNWPGTELEMARQAQLAGIPFTQSSFSNETIEAIAEAAGSSHWFQLYACKDFAIMQDLMDRAARNGVKNLLVTIDTPQYSKRERDWRNGMSSSALPSLKQLLQVSSKPAWALQAALKGVPTLKTLNAYVDKKDRGKTAGNNRILELCDSWYDWDLLAKVRQHWQGKLIIKGVMDNELGRQAIAQGADGLLISNHGGRQFDAAPATIDLLPRIKDSVGDSVPLIIDSGIRSGLDVLRAMELGADFCMSGRSFYYGTAALGSRGAEFVIALLADEITREMKEYGKTSW
ncbi:alpha-hydroxy-acid oxidizing protein [Dasania sp. GY-MA-18]|uniref:Alpha-hydroxy acid oxidase n=1 Tax=Dasania phycosphaerae TaxID=2950436 RepID=A0A9J6RKL8_9GAMM|nr:MULTISPECIES: alpha-hydroxy acid oxidase [Dasania]MCR8922613.1 alpha-hydroxy-acid oxidizing protein [Dasania sp. GY-MA-18]MCZ0865043.1 alpha-hydroxy acid oxidase [Dasania phycosphaerae]MCZ0868769.1 alpha-hydroxy acid oxidase [Dasania phycosphaerae]